MRCFRHSGGTDHRGHRYLACGYFDLYGQFQATDPGLADFYGSHGFTVLPPGRGLDLYVVFGAAAFSQNPGSSCSTTTARADVRRGRSAGVTAPALTPADLRLVPPIRLRSWLDKSTHAAADGYLPTWPGQWRWR